MAEDNKPNQDESSQPASKKKPVAKKAAKKKASAKKPLAKKATAKKATAQKQPAGKTTPAKASVARPSVATPAPSTPAVEIPRAVPQPPPPAPPRAPAPGAGNFDYEAQEEGAGVGGLLVTAGPLIILVFLILVMSNDRTAPSASVASSTQGSVITPVTSAGGLTSESLKELMIDDAARDLSEAFKEAGIKMPAQGPAETASVVPQTTELPAELQHNPWAPQQPGQEAGDNAIPPPPGYPQSHGGAIPGYYGHHPSWGYHKQMQGYNPYMVYPWQMPPPGYGMPMNPYWGQMPGYGMPQGYPPQGMHQGMHQGMQGGYPQQPGQQPDQQVPAQADAPPAPAAKSATQ